MFQSRSRKTKTTSTRGNNQPKFSSDVFYYYINQCAVCDLKLFLDAAHIIPVEDNGSDWDQNGMLLCKNHHSLFDKGLWVVDPDYFEIIPFKNNDLSKMQIHRSNIRHLKVKPAQEALNWRWNDFQKKLNPHNNQ